MRDDENVALRRRTSRVTRRDKLRRLLWAAVESTFFRLSFHTWDAWRSWLLTMFGARIGKQCTIRRTARVYYPWLLKMGELSSLGDRTEVYNLAQVSIGDRVTVSQEAYICAGTHDYTSKAMPLIGRPILIEDDVWICARAFIHPGVRIRSGCIVGACAVVVRDTEEWTVLAGNPAVPVGERKLKT